MYLKKISYDLLHDNFVLQCALSEEIEPVIFGGAEKRVHLACVSMRVDQCSYSKCPSVSANNLAHNHRRHPSVTGLHGTRPASFSGGCNITHRPCRRLRACHARVPLSCIPLVPAYRGCTASLTLEGDEIGTFEGTACHTIFLGVGKLWPISVPTYLQFRFLLGFRPCLFCQKSNANIYREKKIVKQN